MVKKEYTIVEGSSGAKYVSAHKPLEDGGVTLETDSSAKELFYGIYGHPMSWCEWLAKLPTEVGKVHESHLTAFTELIKGVRLRE